MKNHLLVSLKILGMMTLLLGIAYPLFITGIAGVCFPGKAGGSLLEKNGVIVGSELIGQKFDSAAYFAPRPSATDYGTMPSGGSNLALTNQKLHEAVAERRSAFLHANHLPDTTAVPSDMLFASGSGLDPHISPEAAMLQIDRVVRARNLSGEQALALRTIVESSIEKPQFGLLGEPRINVLLLNLQLDNLLATDSAAQ